MLQKVQKIIFHKNQPDIFNKKHRTTLAKMKKTKEIISDEKPTMEEQAFQFEKYKFKMEMFKWFIGSVTLVAITFIIDSGFKERTAGIQEMQAFDQYVEIILKADNIEERWNLSEYFAIVTPTERLRNRWIAYKDSIRPYYNLYKKLKADEFTLRSAALKSDSVRTNDLKLIEIKNQLAPFEKRLINTNEEGSAEVWKDMGFAFLLQKDIENSIKSFRECEKSDGKNQSISAITAYLNENKPYLEDKNSRSWKSTYKKIATDFSTGIPDDTRAKLIEKSK